MRMFFMNGGHGAAPQHDGPACLSFPSNVATQAVEQFENAVPMLMTEKELIPNSGGAGRTRGGCLSAYPSKWSAKTGHGHLSP